MGRDKVERKSPGIKGPQEQVAYNLDAGDPCAAGVLRDVLSPCGKTADATEKKV